MHVWVSESVCIKERERERERERGRERIQNELAFRKVPLHTGHQTRTCCLQSTGGTLTLPWWGETLPLLRPGIQQTQPKAFHVSGCTSNNSDHDKNLSSPHLHRIFYNCTEPPPTMATSISLSCTLLISEVWARLFNHQHLILTYPRKAERICKRYQKPVHRWRQCRRLLPLQLLVKGSSRHWRIGDTAWTWNLWGQQSSSMLSNEA